MHLAVERRQKSSPEKQRFYNARKAKSHATQLEKTCYDMKNFLERNKKPVDKIKGLRYYERVAAEAESFTKTTNPDGFHRIQVHSQSNI